MVGIPSHRCSDTKKPVNRLDWQCSLSAPLLLTTAGTESVSLEALRILALRLGVHAVAAKGERVAADVIALART
jgi:hypothetical protein